MDYRQRFSAEAKGKGKKKVSFSFPSDGASTSQVSLEEENHSLLSNLPDRESYHADDAQFRALRKQNKKLVYKELIPELGRICLDLERSTDKVKRGLYPIPNSADFDVSHSFSHGVHLREILLAGGLDSSDEESDDDDDGKHDIPIGKVPASSKAETEETAGKAGKASEEEEERSLRDNAPSSTSKAKVSHTKSDKSDTREPSNLVDDSTPATPAKVTRRKEKVSEKVDEFRKEVALHTDAVKTYYNKLILERGNRSFFSVADAARVIEFPEVPPSKDVSSINSNLVIKSKKLQFIRALKSMRRAKLSNARKNLRSFEIRSRDVDKELMFNEKQMIIRKSASKNRSIQVPPAVGMQQKQWLPSDTHGDSKNIHAHYHQLIAGGRFNTRESHHSTLWEGSSFKVTLLQDLSTKLRLKVHFMAWKAAYESMLSMDLLITAATNKSNRALKRVVLKEYKKLLVHLRSRTKDAIASIEQFVRKRTLRIWQRQCRRAIFLRLMFQRLSAQHKSRLYKNVMLNWRKMSKREILLRKKFNHLSRTHEARIRRHYLTFWMKHARKEVLLARNFLWLSKVHENNIKRSMMIYWKVMILRERIDGVNVGLASVYLRKKLSHIVMYKWREAVSKANILRNALYSDWDKEGRGHKSTGGSSYKSINPQEGQTSQGMTKLLTEMKRARSALMPKIKLLQDIQPTLWESMVQKNLDCNSGDEEDEEGIDGENEFALKLSRPSYYDEASQPESESETSNPTSKPKIKENVELGNSRSLVEDKERIRVIPTESKHIIENEKMSVGTSPAQPPKLIDEANQGVEDVESQSQDIATITQAVVPVVVDKAVAVTQTVSAGTSPVQPPKMIDEANQAVDTVESQDMATITDESDRVVDIVDEGVATETVSAGTSPVQAPKMIDESNYAVENVESQSQGVATITEEVVSVVVVDEAVAASQTVSAGTSPVQPPKMIDEANQAVDTVESQDMATITEEVVSVVVDEAVTVRASAVTSPVQSEEPVHSTRSDLKFEEPQRVQSKSLRPIGATQTGSVVSIFLPSTEIVQYKSNRGASTSIPPIRSIKELAEAFYHRNLCRKIMKAIKVQLARSKQVNYLAQESYRWHIFRYFLKKWYENTVILSRITVLRGNRVICSNHLKAWRKFTIASKAFNERFDCVRKSHEIHVMRAAFKLCRKAFSGSIMLRGRLAEFRKKMTKIQCQKALHIWRLWSNLHITRRVAVLRINFRVKLRVKRRCLINWWHFVQSNKLLRKVISQATESHGQTHSVERTLENTFSLLMRVLYSWKRLTSLRKGLGGNMSAASIVQRSLAHLTSKRLQGEREAASRETCHRMFLVWYLFVKNLRSSGDDHSGRLKLREKTKFRTESQYYRFKILSKYIKMLRKALMLKETVAKSHNTLRKYTTSWKAWRAFVSNFRNLQLVADRKYSERLLSSTLKSWRLIVMNRIGASKIMRSRLLSVVAAWKEMSSIESKVMKYWKNRTLYAALIRWKASRNSRSSTEANPSRPISNSPYFGLERGKRIVADDIHKWKDSGSNTVPDLQSKLGISTGKQTKVRRNLDAEFARRIPKRVPTSNSILAAQYVLKQNIVGELKEMRSQWKLEELLSKHNHFTQIA